MPELAAQTASPRECAAGGFNFNSPKAFRRKLFHRRHFGIPQSMTTVSKCFVVFALVASLAFLGVVSVSAVGGKNYEADLNEPEFSAYAFTKTEGDDGKVTYSAETRLVRPQDPNNPAGPVDIKKVATNEKVLPQAMIKVLDNESRYQSARLQQLEAERVDLDKKLKAAQAAIAADSKAVQQRLAGLTDAIKNAQTRLSELNKKIVKAEDDARKKQREYQRRQDEIARLENQVEILKADKVRLDEQLVKLNVLEKQLQGEVNAAKQRNDQLKSQPSSSGSSSGAKPPASTTSIP